MHAVVDVDAADVVRVLADPFQLLQRDRSECRIDLYVLTEDDDVHVLPIEFLDARIPVGVFGVYAAGPRPAPGRGVRAIVAANTACAPRRVQRPGRGRERSAGRGDVVDDEDGCAGDAPDRSQGAGRAGGCARRVRSARTRRYAPGTASTAHAARSAPPRGRAAHRDRHPGRGCAAALAGAQVTRSIGAGARCDRPRELAARRRTRKRRSLRYLARATSSRATPSYAKHAVHHSTGGGGGPAGAGAQASPRTQRTRARPRRPHPGQRAGSTASRRSSSAVRSTMAADATERGVTVLASAARRTCAGSERRYGGRADAALGHDRGHEARRA